MVDPSPSRVPQGYRVQQGEEVPQGGEEVPQTKKEVTQGGNAPRSEQADHRGKDEVDRDREDDKNRDRVKDKNTKRCMDAHANADAEKGEDGIERGEPENEEEDEDADENEEEEERESEDDDKLVTGDAVDLGALRKSGQSLIDSLLYQKKKTTSTKVREFDITGNLEKDRKTLTELLNSGPLGAQKAITCQNAPKEDSSEKQDESKNNNDSNSNNRLESKDDTSGKSHDSIDNKYSDTNDNGNTKDSVNQKSKHVKSEEQPFSKPPTEALPPVKDISAMEIPFDARLHEIGQVFSCIGVRVVVKGNAQAHAQAVDQGTVLVLKNKKLIGAVDEVFGPVKEPFYVVRFNNVDEMLPELKEAGCKVFYVEQMASFVLAANLADKGTDASTLNDQEVTNPKEMDFSDDEEERRFKASLKKKRTHQRKEEKGNKSRLPKRQKHSMITSSSSHPTANLQYQGKMQRRLQQHQQYKLQSSVSGHSGLQGTYGEPHPAYGMPSSHQYLNPHQNRWELPPTHRPLMAFQGSPYTYGSLTPYAYANGGAGLQYQQESYRSSNMQPEYGQQSASYRFSNQAYLNTFNPYAAPQSQNQVRSPPKHMPPKEMPHPRANKDQWPRNQR